MAAIAPEDVTLITITADQPTGIALLERFMRRQTVDVGRMPWVVVDDGLEPAALTMGQTHVRRAREADCKPAESFCRNLLEAAARVRTTYALFMEHDDYYAPSHVEGLVDLFTTHREASIAGDGLQRYYNVQHRVWRPFTNVGACLCQTGVHRRLLPAFAEIVKGSLGVNHYGVDGRLWRRVPRVRWALANRGSALGIKGLPGRAGLGLGHRPTSDWTRDPDLAQLRAFIGDDAELYAPFYAPEPLPAVAPRPR